MNAQQILNAVQSQSSAIKTVGVTFKDTKYAEGHQKIYTYKTTRTDLKVDDFAIVEANDALKIVKIVEVHDKNKIDSDSTIVFKWLVDKVNLAAYQALFESDDTALEHIKDDLRTKRAQVILQELSTETKVALGIESQNILENNNGNA